MSNVKDVLFDMHKAKADVKTALNKFQDVRYAVGVEKFEGYAGRMLDEMVSNTLRTLEEIIDRQAQLMKKEEEEGGIK